MLIFKYFCNKSRHGQYCVSSKGGFLGESREEAAIVNCAAVGEFLVRQTIAEAIGCEVAHSATTAPKGGFLGKSRQESSNDRLEDEEEKQRGKCQRGCVFQAEQHLSARDDAHQYGGENGIAYDQNVR